MQSVNSIQQFDKLRHELEEENRQLKMLDDSIRRKEIDHKKAKEVFDKVEKELQDLVKKKEEILHRRTALEGEVKNLQRGLDDLKKHGGTQLKL